MSYAESRPDLPAFSREPGCAGAGRDPSIFRVNVPRRAAIQRHHTVTHLLHWALHEVVKRGGTQRAPSSVRQIDLRFSSAALTPAPGCGRGKLVNEKGLLTRRRLLDGVPTAEIKGRGSVMQFFGEKYGEVVRVVQIGGQPKALDVIPWNFCGGTHTRATGEIGLFASSPRVAERRHPADRTVAGLRAYEKTHSDAT